MSLIERFVNVFLVQRLILIKLIVCYKLTRKMNLIVIA
jgi:hypothetical protein